MAGADFASFITPAAIERTHKKDAAEHSAASFFTGRKKNAGSRADDGNFGLPPRRDGCLSGEHSGVAKREREEVGLVWVLASIKIPHPAQK